MKKLPALLLLAALTVGAEPVKEAFYISPELKEVDIRQIPRRPWGDGFVMTDEGPMCDNGEHKQLAKGVGKRIVLDQQIPLPVSSAARNNPASFLDPIIPSFPFLSRRIRRPRHFQFIHRPRPKVGSSKSLSLR